MFAAIHRREVKILLSLYAFAKETSREASNGCSQRGMMNWLVKIKIANDQSGIYFLLNQFINNNDAINYYIKFNTN